MHKHDYNISLCLSVPLSLYRPAGWLLSGMSGLTVSQSGHDLPRLWPGQTGPRSCNRTRNVPLVVFCFVLFHFFVERLEYASLCTCRSKRNHFLGITWGGLHKRTLCECNEIIKAYAVLCVATEDALFFLFSLWLSSSKATENVIYFRSSTFSLWTYFWC